MKSGLKDFEFADKIGISPSFLSQILNGKRSGQRDIFRICRKMGKTISEMVGETNYPDALDATAKQLKELTEQIKMLRKENNKSHSIIKKIADELMPNGRRKIDKFLKLIKNR